MIHEVIAAPRPGVVEDHLFRKLAQRRLVRQPGPLGESDDDVGADLQMATVGVDLVARVNLGDRRLAGRGITKGQQLLADLLDERVALRRLHAAVGIAAPQVDVQAVQADPVGLGARPVDVAEVGDPGSTARVVQHDVAVVEQPGVQVEGTPPRGETVIRHHHQRRVLGHPVERGPDHLVDLEVPVDDGIGEWRIGDRVVSRVLRIHRPPHHVRHLVEVAEVVEEQSVLEAVEDPVVLTADLAGGDRRLGHEVGVVENAVVEGVGLLGQSLGVEAAADSGELRREVVGRRDRHGRAHGVEVDRRDVELELGVGFLEVEAAHAADRHQVGDQLERHFGPVAPLPLPQDNLLAADLDLGDRALRIDINGELGLELLRLDHERVGRAGDHGFDDAIADLDAVEQIHLLGDPLRLGRVEGIGPGRAQDVGRSHAAELVARRSGRGEVGRHPDDRGRHAACLEHLPERRSPAQELHAPGRERDAPFADVDRPFGLVRLGGREIGDHVVEVAVQEVVDSVAARI